MGHGRIACTNNLTDIEISKKTAEKIKKLTFTRHRYDVLLWAHTFGGTFRLPSSSCWFQSFTCRCFVYSPSDPNSHRKSQNIIYNCKHLLLVVTLKMISKFYLIFTIIYFDLKKIPFLFNSMGLILSNRLVVKNKTWLYIFTCATSLKIVVEVRVCIYRYIYTSILLFIFFFFRGKQLVLVCSWLIPRTYIETSLLIRRLLLHGIIPLFKLSAYIFTFNQISLWFHLFPL